MYQDRLSWVRLVTKAWAERAAGRDGHGDDAAPALGRVPGRAVDGRCAPVVTDEHGALVTTERVVQRDGVHAQRPRLEDAVIGYPGGRIPSLEGGHRSEAGIGQERKEVAPGVGRIGEAVEAQGEGTVSAREVVELDAVGRGGAGLERGGHGRTLPTARRS